MDGNLISEFLKLGGARCGGPEDAGKGNINTIRGVRFDHTIYCFYVLIPSLIYSELVDIYIYIYIH